MKSHGRRLTELESAFVPTCCQCGAALECPQCRPHPLHQLSGAQLGIFADHLRGEHEQRVREVVSAALVGSGANSEQQERILEAVERILAKARTVQ